MQKPKPGIRFKNKNSLQQSSLHRLTYTCGFGQHNKYIKGFTPQKLLYLHSRIVAGLLPTERVVPRQHAGFKPLKWEAEALPYPNNEPLDEWALFFFLP